MAITCYLCGKDCHGVDVYADHLRNFHCLIEPCTLKCNVGGCLRSFSTYSVLRRHIKKVHQEHLETFKHEQGQDTHHNSPEITYELPGVCASATMADETICSPCVDESGISKAAVTFLTALASSSSIPLSTVDFVRNSAKELVHDILRFLKAHTESVLIASGVDTGSPSVTGLLSNFDGWMDPFQGVDSQSKLLSYLQRKRCYTPPVACSLGKRWETQRDRKSKNVKQVQVDDMFYYIPLKNTLELVLNQPETWDLLNKWEDGFKCSASGFQACSDLLEDWLDSEHGLKTKLHCQSMFPDSLPIILQVYFDEVELVNPLGSKTGIHKLGAFYFTIRNFPPLVNSATHNIHLFALAHAQDLKQHGMDGVLNVLVDELQRLHDVGFKFARGQKQQHVRCLLSQVVGDNLGLHSLLGYVENFNCATHPCDLCLSTQDDVQTVHHEKHLTLRTADLYDQQVSNLAAGMITVTDCGIKRPSVLAKLTYYHPASNDSSDIMHDLFEGVIPYETKLFICHILYEVKPTCLSLTELNHRIKAADYGQCNSRSKPSLLVESHLKSPDSNLGQRSAQMLTLFYFLPLIIADVILLADPMKLRVNILLHQIVDIVLSSSISTSSLSYLQSLVHDHHGLFKECYPERKLLYKHHRMIHYATLIRRSGPLTKMNVIRYEAKHNFFKRLGHIICNYRNISFSLAKRHQISQAFAWSTRSPLKSCLDFGDGDMLMVDELSMEERDLLLPFVGSGVEVFVPQWLSIYGQQYCQKMTVLASINEDADPRFASISKMYVNSDRVYFAVQYWLVHEFSYEMHAYGCTMDDRLHCIAVDEIADYKPLTATDCSKHSCVYKHIVLRHMLCSDKIYLPQ
jgi:hypothetical protein